MTIDLAQFAGETIWAAWGRAPGERAQAMKLGATLAMAAENAGYRLAKQEKVIRWLPIAERDEVLWRDLS